jgi:hypothetical protein
MKAISPGYLGAASKQDSLDLRGCRYVDIEEVIEEVDLHESCNHKPVARNWPNSRKRWAATVACINTACLGIIIGIYAGEVPAIQHLIVDFHHYMILGDVFCTWGLSIPTLICLFFMAANLYSWRTLYYALLASSSRCCCWWVQVTIR